jgi:hypothetical protein
VGELDRSLTARNTSAVRSVCRAVGLCSPPLLAVACGRDPDSGIKGRVVPCGIVLERPAPCAASKWTGTIVVGDGRHVKAQADGSFRVRLAAGRYWLQARTGETRGPRTRVSVSEGRWTTVTLVAGRVGPPRGTSRSSSES